MKPRHIKTHMTADGTKGFWCGTLDEDNAHIIVSENGREIARIVRRLPLSQRVDVSLLKRVKGLPWDGQGLVRRGGPPKLTLERPTMTETWIIFEWSTVIIDSTLAERREGRSGDRVGACGKAATFQKQDLDPAVVEESKKLRSTEPTSDTGDSTKIDLTDAETRKRTLVETTDDDDDELAEKYWRAEDVVAKASMDELTGNWLTDENGIFDNDAAEDIWADCPGAGGELDRQAEAEATEKALEA